MFKATRWRNEKIKAVFRLQFQATQVTESGSRLMISVVPAGLGQPTVRLGKVLVRDGACTWENPIYETIKFIREPKTGKLQDKIYHFILATGSSRKGLLGEVSINFAAYAEATTPATVSLPIKAATSEAVLHVTIQNMQGADDQRDIQENRESRVKSGGRTLQTQLDESRSDENDDHNSNEDDFYKPTIALEDERSRNFRNCSTSNSIPEQRSRQDVLHNVEVTIESPSRQNSMSKRRMRDGGTDKRLAEQQIKIDSSLSEDMVSSIKHEKDTFSEESEKDLSCTSIELLKSRISTLQRQADVTELELQSLRRQIVKESKRGQELSRQLISRTEERDALKTEFETLKSWHEKDRDEVQEKKETAGRSRLWEIEQELIHQKDLNTGLRSQLQETQDSNSELILVLRDLKEIIERKDKDLFNLSNKIRNCRNVEEFQNIDSVDKWAKNKLVLTELIPNKNNTEEVNLLRQKIKNLQGDLKGHIKGKEELEIRITQLIQEYEISEKEIYDLSFQFEQKRVQLIKKENQCTHYLSMISELDAKIISLKNVIRKQADESSKSSDIIHKLENRVKCLEKELEKQAHEFAPNLDEALFRKLSRELASKSNENEKLTTKAQTEARDQRLQISVLEEQIQKANEELGMIRHHYNIEMRKISDQLLERDKEVEQFVLKLEGERTLARSTMQKEEENFEDLQKENQMLRIEIERLTEENYHFSEHLEQTKDLISGIELMKMSMDETNKQLELINKEKGDLERKYVSVRMEAQQSQEQLNVMMSLKETKELMDKSIQSEVEKLREQHDELKNHLLEEQLENQKLRKQIIQQKGDLQKKDHAILQIGEKFKNSNSREVVDLTEKVKQLKEATYAGIPPENGSKMEETRQLARRLQHSELSTFDNSQQNEAIKAPGKSSSKELCTHKNQKVPESEIRHEAHLTELLTEITLLKEKNKSMEGELKEMQEKYSDVSLRFAEVEGERQQLVMTIRNLRNGQKK
ncbi:hypothetical protein Nepgr_010836 [Nepenthes gracilis]|uniref:C2 NT-type domain-containing protein n=1 Tax=Nepenthes gracilis TaxID=150966 RepID=A0AAD3SDZ9_NEPGR|nr:hypothetical protein Nepgr_010836 [Nepenthes gracilis]